jgi:NADP-dependent 3-hydroxy acid dehydrogenase YdfG
MGALTGVSALVTGASRGIGEAVAHALSGHDADVWLMAHSVDRLQRLGAELGATPVPCDLRDEGAITESAERIRNALGGAPDLLVNCAGVFDIAPFQDTTYERLEANLAANLKGPFMLIRAFLPDMLERGSGLIVNVGSVAGRRAFPGNAAYSASKFGLRGAHEVLREETRGTGVRVTLVEPGAVDTGIWDPIDPDADPGLPDRADMLMSADVADAVTFVARSPASVAIPLIQVERA